MSAYDYIIIGAGSAGCVLANRLTEDQAEPASVLLLEAGGHDDDPRIRVPRDFEELQGTRVDWAYETQQEPRLNGRQIQHPRGKVLGGTSAINAMIYIRGNRRDFDNWAALGNRGWSYEEVLPYFIKAENNRRRDISRLHGKKGPLTVSDPDPPSRASVAFVRAADELGYGRKDDFNGMEQEGGAGVFQFTIKNGRRDSTAAAYLTQKVRRRPNLTVETDAQAARLLIDNYRVRGVEYVIRAESGRAVEKAAQARREVIVCCGAIDTPKLLMLSGIGPAGHLREVGIQPVVNLPGVGENLQDHLVAYVAYFYKDTKSEPSADGGIEAGLFVRTRGGELPDLQFHFLHKIYGRPPDPAAGYMIVPTLVKPLSRGTVRLRSASFGDKPLIRANYLTHDADLQTLVSGIKIARRIGGADAFEDLRGAEAFPGPNVTADEQIAEYIKTTSLSIYHPACSCPMGVNPERGAVVSPDLKVYGVKGLRVVDASVMPVITTGNTNAPTIMIAEKAADMIKAEWGETGRASGAVGDIGERPPPMKLPPTFPPGVNPETYKLKEVNQLLKSAAYFPIFNVANPDTPNQPVPLVPGIPFLQQYLMTAVEVNEELHRFEVNVGPPTAATGLRTSDRVGEPVANVHIRWTPIPENFEAAPDLCPPPTVLNPFVSQRFVMLNGRLTFKDQRQSGFRAFGAGRTFPVNEGGQWRLRIGAAIEVLEGMGAFAGHTGAFVVNGYIQPPRSLALNLVVRVMDPTGELTARGPLTPLREMPSPDPDAAFMYFLGETDPARPVKLNVTPDGRILGSQVYERLRIAHFDFDLGSGAGPRSLVNEGPFVGDVVATLHFNPLAPTSVSPISTTGGVFTFYDSRGQHFGQVFSNMVEGRAMRTELAGAPMPVFRFAGFGPILGGTGQFDGAEGMMTMNSAISVFPRTLSNLYTFRLYDPSGRFRDAAHRAWFQGRR